MSPSRKAKEKRRLGKSKGNVSKPSSDALPKGVGVLRRAKRTADRTTLDYGALVQDFNSYLHSAYRDMEADIDDMRYFLTRKNFPDYERLLSEYVKREWDLNGQAATDVANYIANYVKSGRQDQFAKPSAS